MKISFSVSACFVILIIFTMSNLSFALPKSICQEKIIQSGTVTGKLDNIEEIDSRYFITIILDNGEQFIAQCLADGAKKYNPFRGAKVSAKYQVEQYWDEHDDECVREERVTDVAPMK